MADLLIPTELAADWFSLLERLLISLLLTNEAVSDCYRVTTGSQFTEGLNVRRHIVGFLGSTC